MVAPSSFCVTCKSADNGGTEVAVGVAGIAVAVGAGGLGFFVEVAVAGCGGK